MSLTLKKTCTCLLCKNCLKCSNELKFIICDHCSLCNSCEECPICGTTAHQNCGNTL